MLIKELKYLLNIKNYKYNFVKSIIMFRSNFAITIRVLLNKNGVELTFVRTIINSNFWTQS